MVAVKVGPATLIGAGALLILGSLLPWATVSAGFISASKNGTSGDGIMTLICGALVVGLGIWLMRSETPLGWLIGGAVVLLVALGISVYDMTNLPSPGNYGGGSFTISIGVEIGIGLWLCLIRFSRRTRSNGIHHLRPRQVPSHRPWAISTGGHCLGSDSGGFAGMVALSAAVN